MANPPDYLSAWLTGAEAMQFAVNFLWPGLCVVSALRLVLLGVSKPKSL